MRGMTLIEIVVAMSMLGLVAAVVLPSLVVPPTEPASIGQVVRNARGRAIARAQPLVLDVAASGRWQLRTEGGAAVDSGAIASAFAVAFNLSPAGHCRIATPMPAQWQSWDVARCTAVERP